MCYIPSVDLGIFDVPAAAELDEDQDDYQERRPPTEAPVRPGAVAAPRPAQETPTNCALRSDSARTDVGVSMVWLGIGAVAGAAAMGPLGAASGALLVGAARNGYRAYLGWSGADTATRQEATKSATVALFGAGISGMLAFAAMKKGSDNG
jgi:hypothetical protein